MALARGDVYRLDFPAQDPARAGQMIPKWVVVLQGGRYWRDWPSVLIAVATSKAPTLLWPHFVYVPAGPPGGFETESWIDCGDLYRRPKTDFDASKLKGRLDASTIAKVDDALQIGVGTLDGSIYVDLGA